MSGIIQGLEGLGEGYLFGNEWVRKINEIAEEMVILLSQFSCVRSRVKSPEVDALLMVFNFRYAIVCCTVRLWCVESFKSATTEKWLEIISDVL